MLRTHAEYGFFYPGDLENILFVPFCAFRGNDAQEDDAQEDDAQEDDAHEKAGHKKHEKTQKRRVARPACRSRGHWLLVSQCGSGGDSTVGVDVIHGAAGPPTKRCYRTQSRTRSRWLLIFVKNFAILANSGTVS